MSEQAVIETIYGKYSKFEIVRETSVLGSPKFYIRKDGKHHKGAFASLSDAVEAAKNEAG